MIPVCPDDLAAAGGAGGVWEACEGRDGEQGGSRTWQVLGKTITNHLDWRRVNAGIQETDGELQRWAKLIFNNTNSAQFGPATTSLLPTPSVAFQKKHPYLLSQEEPGSAEERQNTVRHQVCWKGKKWQEKGSSSNSQLLQECGGTSGWFTEEGKERAEEGKGTCWGGRRILFWDE